ncbi:MAG: PAS domain S-box protein [Planctomycetota bacterium]|nr:MAG: PAS domain S-box protein [Planctomycetota bacterium]
MGTIPVVEDDHDVARLQRIHLERAGYTVVLADTSRQALQRATAGGIDLAVVDYLLEDGVTGLDLFERFKDAGLTLPVILVTGFSEEETVIRALRAGVSDFVPKSSAYLSYLPEAIARTLRHIAVEKRLAESEARFASFMDNSPVVASIKDEQGRVVYANWMMQRLFRCDDWHGKTVFDLLPSEAAQSIWEGDKRVMQGRETVECVYAAPDLAGKMHRWLAYRFPIEDLDGRELVGGVAIDLTERVEAEEALRNSEARFRSMSETAPDAMITIDQAGRVISWNPAAERIFGYTAEEMHGQTIACIIPERLRDTQHAALGRVLREGPETMHRHLPDLYALRKDGSEFPVEISVGAWQQDGKVFCSGFIRDVTQAKQAEEELRIRDEQLRHAQKLESLGTLAGGVAHEFNNLLQSVQGYTRYAMEGLPPESRHYQDLEVVLTAAQRAATLTRQLLGFSRRQVLNYVDLDPNQIIKDSVRMLRPLIGEHISLELALQEGARHVHADAAHLQQLLINLCVNARDAMPEGGRLLIQTEEVDLDEADCTHFPELSPGHYLTLVVSDTGCGMAPEVLEHIFDPFFTTKEVGKGTGLGMATVYGVVSQHRGTVRVESTPGGGTAVTIYLPTVEPQPPLEDTADISPPARHGETVLVAEDDPLVRELTERTLGSAGYRTISADDGAEAVRIFEARRHEISLVLLDVVMPRINGHEVYRQMRLIDPNVKAIFASAYDLETAQLGFIGDQGLRFVQKPADPAELLKTVREVLDAQSTLVS